MNRRLLLKLADFSDELEDSGLGKFADMLDEIIEEQESISTDEVLPEGLRHDELEIEIPQGEKDFLVEVLESLERSLK